MADILSNLASTLSSGLKNIGQQNNQFKNAAAQQNNGISRFVKDIGRYFSIQSQQQNSLNGSIGDLAQATASNSAKIDQSNSLLRESISVQNQMLVELRTNSNYIKKLTNDFNDNQNNGNSILSTIASILGGAAVGAAATAGISAIGGFSGIDSALTGASNYLSNGASNLIGALGGGGGAVPPTPASGSTQQIMDTIKTVESGGDYTKPNMAGTSSASGAYQFTDGTWQDRTQKYGIGTE